MHITDTSKTITTSALYSTNEVTDIKYDTVNSSSAIERLKAHATTIENHKVQHRKLTKDVLAKS